MAIHRIIKAEGKDAVETIMGTTNTRPTKKNDIIIFGKGRRLTFKEYTRKVINGNWRRK